MLGIAGLMLAVSASAAPVYLRCEFVRDDGNIEIEFAVDEPNQLVTIALPSGRVVTRRGLFGPSEVRIPDQPSVWTIDRVNLTLRRTFDFRPASDAGESGKCKIKDKPPKRAF